jgi:hypothetical protein
LPDGSVGWNPAARYVSWYSGCCRTCRTRTAGRSPSTSGIPPRTGCSTYPGARSGTPIRFATTFGLRTGAPGGRPIRTRRGRDPGHEEGHRTLGVQRQYTGTTGGSRTPSSPSISPTVAGSRWTVEVMFQSSKTLRGSTNTMFAAGTPGTAGSPRPARPRVLRRHRCSRTPRARSSRGRGFPCQDQHHGLPMENPVGVSVARVRFSAHTTDEFRLAASSALLGTSPFRARGRPEMR